jgi:hypothetical protein
LSRQRLVVSVAYLREGVPGLSIAEQEELFAQAGISLAGAYQDSLNPTQLRRREPGSLRQRAKMLSQATYPTPNGVPEVIHVAALRCIGWSVADVARSLAAASRLGSGVHAIDTGQTFSASTLHSGLLEALADLDQTWRRGQTEEGRSAAAAVIAAKAEEARRAKIEAARPLWVKPSSEISSVEITQRVGMSLRSLHKWLGPRRKTTRSGAQ